MVVELTPQVEHKAVEVDGRRVAYTARGPEDASSVYLGVHGLMGGGDSFWPVIAGVPHHWRVVLPDLPGCGGSETMPAPHRHTVEGYAGWLDRFLGAVGLADRALTLASVATGAAIAIRYGLDHAEQVRGQVMHLPFLGRAAITKKWARPVVAYGLSVPPLRALVHRLRSSRALMHRIILHEPPDAIPELAERDIRHKQHADLTAAGQLLHSLMLTDSVSQMAFLHHPILILASEHDFTAPLWLLEMLVRNRPERRLYVHRGGQHSWNEPFIEEMNREIARFTGKLLNAHNA